MYMCVYTRALTHDVEQIMSTLQPRVLVGLGREDVFVALNVPENHVPPSFDKPFVPDTIEPWAIWRTRWVYDRYHYLVFLPSVNRYPGILRDLDMTPGTVPVQATQHSHGRVSYRLAQSKVDQLLSLYHLANTMIHFFYNYFTYARPIIFIPGDTILSCFRVSQETLLKEQKTQRAVMATALAARDSIMANFAYVSYCVAWHTSDKDDEFFPAWYWNLRRKMPIDCVNLVEALRGTWVLDLRAPRIGGFVQATTPVQYDRASDGAASNTWMNHLHRLILSAPGVPVYLHYPQPVKPGMKNLWEHAVYYQPSRERVQAARAKLIQPVLPARTVPSAPIKRPSPTDHQNANIPWAQFKEQLDSWFQYKESTASATDLATWKARQEEATRRTPWEINEGKKSWEQWTVWVWEDNGDGTWNHLVRSAKPSALAADWKVIPPSQKIVDPIQRDWHISYHFPNEQEDLDDAWWAGGAREEGPRWRIPSATNSGILAATRNRSRSRSPPTSVSRGGRTRSPVETLRARSRSASPPPFQQEDVMHLLPEDNTPYNHQLPDTFIACVRARFGIPEQARPLESSLRRIPSHILKTVFKYDEKWHGPVSERDWALVGDLFGGHANGKPKVDVSTADWRTVAETLKNICDIFPGSPFHHPYNVVGRQHYLIAPVSVPAMPERHVQAHTAYLLIPKQGTVEDQPWLVCLQDPLSVLQVLRADWGPEAELLVCALAVRGIPFRTLRLKKEYTPYVSHEVRTGLQLMPQGYVPTSQDYAVYTLRLKDLILCHGRPALLKGGIIWRLAMEVLGEDDEWALHALSIPTDCSEPYFVASYNDYQGVDEELTQQEEDIVCGVYRVFSDNVSTGTCSCYVL